MSSSTKQLYRIYDTFTQQWWYVYSSDKTNAIRLARTRILKKVGKFNITTIQRKDIEWQTLQK